MTTATSIDPGLIATLTAAAEERDGHPERNEWRFRCPFPGHVDNHPSARWNPDKGTFVCDVCKKGGGAIDLARLLNIDLPKSSSNGHRPTISNGKSDEPAFTLNAYSYHEIEEGRLVCQSVRKQFPDGRKEFYQRRPQKGGGWINNMQGVTPPLYRLLDINTEDITFVLEGEKDVERFYSEHPENWSDFRATTNIGGAGKWKDRYSEQLMFNPTLLIPDNDRPGYQHMLKVYRSLEKQRSYWRDRGKDVTPFAILQLTDVPEKGDLSDWLDRGHRLEDIDAYDILIEGKTPEIPGARIIDVDELARLAGESGTKNATDDVGKSSYVHMFARDESNIDVPELPTFPVDVFPDAIRKYVAEGAESHNVPPDMIALPLLGFASGVIGNTIAVQVKPGWIERPILWTAIVGDPGSGKSLAIDYARAPLDVLQREAWEQYQRKLTEWEEAITEAKANKDRTDPLPEKPVLQHFFSTDATPEALASMLSTSPGVNVVRDELVGWVKSHDAYRKAGDRQLHLSLWAGSPMKVDRRGAGSTYIPRPSVSIIGGIQPEMLTELAEEANRRDGFVERILMAWPQSRPMTWNEATIDSTAAWEVEYIFRKLRIRAMGADSDIVLKFSAEARRVFGNWYNDNGRIIAETSGIASGCYAKYPGQLARIALVLHCLHHSGDTTTDIASETVEDAIEVIEYLRQHLIRILPSFSASGSMKTASLEGRILRILGKAQTEWVARRELIRGLGNSVPSDDIRVALEQLETAAKVENRIVPTGSRPREESRLLVSHNRTYEHMNKSPNGTAPNGAYVHMCDGDEEQVRV